jgi:hypothetical protein
MINTREMQIKTTGLEHFRPTRAGAIIKHMKKPTNLYGAWPTEIVTHSWGEYKTTIGNIFSVP